MSTQQAFRSLQTLIVHSVGFPHPSMSNKPEFFGLDATKENIKKFMSLGKMRLFPSEVQERVFGSMDDSPIHEWELIRSQFQSFVNSYTFAFMNIGRSLPIAKLPACTELERLLKLRGEDAKIKYIAHYEQLKDESIRFWRDHSELYHISADDMELFIRASFPKRDSIEDKFRFTVSYFEAMPPELIGQVNQIDALEKQGVIEACNKVASEAGKQLKEQVDEFVVSVAADLEEKTKVALCSLIDSIKSGKWNQKSINSVLKFAEEFHDINFINYTELQEFMDGFKVQLSEYKAQDVKSDTTLTESMTDFLNQSVGQLEEMAQEDKQEVLRGFGSMGRRKLRPF